VSAFRTPTPHQASQELRFLQHTQRQGGVPCAGSTQRAAELSTRRGG